MVILRFFWNNRHPERSQSEVEGSIVKRLYNVITVAIDISTLPHNMSMF